MADGIVVVTGADGFVGRALCAHMADSGRTHRAVVREVDEHAHGLLDAIARSDTVTNANAKAGACVHHPVRVIALGDLATVADAQLDAALGGASAVVHLAGRAHVLRDDARDPAALYNAANLESTRRLANAALRSGVTRFILASSVKVLGEATPPGHPFTHASKPSPQDDYAHSKLAAERALLEICEGSHLTPIILRLPLVYGPGVRANFLRLFDAVGRQALLPIGSIANRRDLLYVGNLVATIETLLDSSTAPAGTWLIADGQSVSTPELARRIGHALCVSPRILSVPVPLLELGMRLVGRGGEIARLAQSLEIDASPLRDIVGRMPYTLDQGLATIASWWRTKRSNRLSKT